MKISQNTQAKLNEICGQLKERLGTFSTAYGQFRQLSRTSVKNFVLQFL